MKEYTQSSIAKEMHSLAKKLASEKQLKEGDATDLRDVLHFADRKYYVDDDPILSDKEYDELFAKLKTLEAEHPGLMTDDSPTQRVAMGLSERFTTVAHLVPMLSLDNTYNAEDIKEWDKRCRGLVREQAIEYCVEPKYDGAGISLLYENNRLTRGVTRGDGTMGEDVTINIKQIRSIPLKAEMFAEGPVEIRGEIVIHKETFAEYNRQRTAEGLPPLANPRNAASGTLRMLDPKEVARRRLTAVLYNISDYGPIADKVRSHYEAIEWLMGMGFPTPIKEMRRFTDVEELVAYCKQFEERRDTLPYEVDGLVIKVNSLAMQQEMGATSHHPRWAVAYKFQARQATSQLERVEFQVGRTGAVTPVAKITPVLISGVTVTSVSLFNEDVVREKDLRIGDTVLVERAGDVIPYIVKPLSELRDGSEQTIVFPSHCPKCDQPLERIADEAAWRCVNISCPAQVVERIMHYCSKDAMDVRGMGESNVRKFYEMGLLPDVPSLYTLDWEQLNGLEGFGKKSIENLKEAINASKKQPLNRLIFGLGIRHVGEIMAKTIAKRIANLRDLYDMTADDLVLLDDVGPKVALSIIDFFKIDANRSTIDALEREGVNLSNTSTPEVQGRFTGKTFLFTGTLQQLKRSDAEAMAEAEGGKIASGVSAKLTYLIVGEEAGSKLDKARKTPSITILDEEAFLKMMKESAGDNT